MLHTVIAVCDCHGRSCIDSPIRPNISGEIVRIMPQKVPSETVSESREWFGAISAPKPDAWSIGCLCPLHICVEGVRFVQIVTIFSSESLGSFFKHLR